MIYMLFESQYTTSY